MYDVVVVGAGPSGSFTALTLARESQLNILLVDEHKKIGVPVHCAGGIAKHWVDHLGLKVPREVIASEVWNTRFFGPRGSVCSASSQARPLGYVMYRDLFDQWLVAEAERHGVKVKNPCRISSLEEARRYGRIIVGADGWQSNIGRWAGLSYSLSGEDKCIGVQVTLETKYETCNDTIDLYFGRNIAPKGYAWIFPEGEDRLRIGLGSPISERVNVKSLLDAFIWRWDGEVVDRVGGVIETAPPLKTCVRDHVLLVGDAARMCDPLTGGGIANGMVSGKLAAQAIISGRLSSYDMLWKRELGRRLYRRYWFKNMLYGLGDEAVDGFIQGIGNRTIKEEDPDVEFEKVLRKSVLRSPRVLYSFLKAVLTAIHRKTY